MRAFPSCRGAAQFNHPAGGNAGMAFEVAVVSHWPGLPQPER
jgi:hypothetical protein